MKNLTRKEQLSVTKPSRYVGGEYNQVIKNLDDIKCRFAFCFPDIYDIGMSNLGMKILYNVLQNLSFPAQATRFPHELVKHGTTTLCCFSQICLFPKFISPKFIICNHLVLFLPNLSTHQI